MAKLGILAAAVTLLFLLARWGGLDRQFTKQIEKRLRQTTDLRVTSFEEVLLLDEGYGVVEVYVQDDTQIAHKTLGQSQLRTRGMVVMAIDRAGTIMPAPHAETMLLPGDRLICYGKVKTIGGIAVEKNTSLISGKPLVKLQA
jgi:K+/H+ antiporter YhaU regulatory subunit KhtT